MVVTLAFASAGYVAPDRGLLVLAFALVSLVAVVASDRVTVGPRGLVLVGALAGLAAWTVASAAWSPAAAWPVLEAERTLVYAVAAAALVLTITPARVLSLACGIGAGATVVGCYALATRLFPGEVGGAFDSSGGYQLAAPIGYWNALGLLLSMAIVLSAGVALRGPTVLRVVAGAALVPLATALFLTFSRGALVALAAGVAALLAVDPRCVRTAAGLAALAAVPAISVGLASRARGLTTANVTLEAARSDGHRLAWQLGLLTIAAAAASWLLARRGSSLRAPGRPLRAAAAFCACLALAAVAVGVARAGGPARIAERALEAFAAEAPPPTGAQSARLLSVSGHGRADYWRVAWRMVERSPVIGEGGGSFERRWLAERPAPHEARDAHSLYLETLAELGFVGLALLLVAIATPLTAVGRARRAPLGPAALGAFVALLAHAALDWDWELPLLVLCGLACAVALIALAQEGEPVPIGGVRRVAGVLVLAGVLAVALVAHVGNRALASGREALARGDLDAALSHADRARTWAPWSHEPWQLRGEAHHAAGEEAAARSSLREAARRAPEDWSVWLDAAEVETAARRGAALTHARDLNPLSPEVSEPVDR